MAASAAAKRLVVFGGTGFVGSGIAKEAVKRGFDVTCVTRGGAAPAHLLGDAERGWASEIDWRRGVHAFPPGVEGLRREGEGEQEGEQSCQPGEKVRTGF